jgi:hypothetical protein
MKPSKTIAIFFLATALTFSWAFIGGVFVRGDVNSSWAHYVAAALALPFRLTSFLPVSRFWQGIAGLSVMFVICALIVSVAFYCVGRRRAGA